MDRNGQSFGLGFPFKMVLHMCLGQSGETIQGHFPVFSKQVSKGENLCVVYMFIYHSFSSL